MNKNEFLIDGTVVALTKHALERIGERSVHELRELVVNLLKHGQRRVMVDGKVAINWRDYKAICVLGNKKIIMVTLLYFEKGRAFQHQKEWKRQARKLERANHANPD